MNSPVMSEFQLGPAALSAHWGWLALRGALAILFGLLALGWPALTIATLTLVWGAYAVVDGTFAAIYGTRGGGTWRWTYAVVGLIGILAGLTALFLPGQTAVMLVIIIGVWALTIGFFEIVYAFQYRQANAHPWVIGVTGLLSMCLGLLIVIYPGAGALSMIWLIGSYSICYGVLLIVATIHLRRFQHEMA